ncbi:MAG: rod shape-determining protein MreC [Anaerolineales bacterium]
MNLRSARTLRNITLVLLAIGLIALALSGYLNTFTKLVLSPLVVVQTWVSGQYQAVEDFITAPRDVAVIRQRNAELEAEVAQLQSQIIEMQQQLTEYEILAALVDFARAHPDNLYLGATVIGRDPSPFLHYIIINKGSDDGLRRGMPVVTQQGLVGRISRVTAEGSTVQLITDPASSINIRIEPSSAEAVLSGSITGDISLDLIPQTANVKPGDLVLTSGLGGNYPTNILIGRVTGVRSQDVALFQNASVQPTVDFSQLEIVLVITNFKPVDITPLIPAPEAP